MYAGNKKRSVMWWNAAAEDVTLTRMRTKSCLSTVAAAIDQPIPEMAGCELAKYH
jgi:hypothetical protein